MASGFNQITDLYEIYDTVQNTLIRFPVDYIIASLKEFFSRDSRYHYVKDEWGFAKTPDLTDVDTEAGLYDDVTTRLFIGQKHRFDVIFYPAILVYYSNFRYVPISMSRDHHVVDYETVELVDGYGNSKIIRRPYALTPSGAWEGSITIEVLSRGHRERDDLVELISMFLTDYNWSNFYRAGISIKPNLSIGSYSDSEDRNDKLYRVPITLEVRGEWRREILISNFVEVINFCVDFGNLLKDPEEIAPNLEINTQVSLIESFDVY